MLSDLERKHHELYMRRAIRLARRGIGRTHPNPRVGAVVVKNGVIVGEGWHEFAGGPHAEVIALKRAGEKAKGSTIYVTLEPCASHGRTPPCTDAIRAAGVANVVYASPDPNPKMAGGGKVLEASHLGVIGNFMQADADALNRPFFRFMRSGLPYVTAKAAISLDGKLATRTHHSQWISGERSRLHAQKLRARVDAIVVGAGTLAIDNPSLTVRDVPLRGKPPLRVVLCIETPRFMPESKLLDDAAPTRFYVHSRNTHADAWEDAGVEIVQQPSLDAALRHLAADGKLHLLLEGGGNLHASFFEGRFTQELLLYQASMLIGGRDAVPLWSGLGVEDIKHAVRLDRIERQALGDDMLIRGELRYPEGV